MAKELLTAKSLEQELKKAQADAAARRTRVRISDGNNLQLVVRDSGGASWQLLAWVNGKRKPLTLGKWPDVTLKRARDLAQAARDQVATGVDPVEQKRLQRLARARAEADKDCTVRTVLNDWLDKHPGSTVYIGNIQAAFKKDVLPEIGAMHPGAVERRHIIALLRKMERRDALVMLRRLRMWLKQMYEFAMDAELVTTSPVPSGHMKSFMAPEEGHFAAITDPVQVPKLMAAIAGYPHPVVRMALQMTAHTFQRPTEVREAKWEEFDLDAAKWVIPEFRMKKRREHWVPLSPSVVAMLRKHQGVVGDAGWLFPGRRYDQPISEGTLKGALDAMGFNGLHTAHGFRAMAHTIMVEHLKIDERFIEKQLSHEEENKVKRAYNRAEYYDDRVKLMAAWSEWLDAQTPAPESSQ